MSITTIDDFVSSVANNDTMKLLTFHSTGLKSASFSVNDADATGDTAIEVAITTSNHKMMKLLLERFKCDPDISGKKNQTPLRLAARRNDVKSCEILCQYGADVNLTRSNKNVKAKTSTTTDENEDDVVNSSHQKTTSGVASSNNSNSNNDDDNLDGWTPLHVAIFGMKHDVINFFLDMKKKEDTEEEEASKNNNNNANKTSTIISNKIDFTIQTKREGATVLHFAAAQGVWQAVQRILQIVFDSSSSSNNDNNNSNNSSLMTKLLNIQDNQGDTALHSALHFRMSKSLGGRYHPPESPQWSIAFTLAFCGINIDIGGEDAVSIAYSYLEHRVPAVKKVLQSLNACGKCVLISSDNKTSSPIPYLEYSELVDEKNLSSIKNIKKILCCEENNTKNNKSDDEAFKTLQSNLKELEGQRQAKNEEAAKQFLEAKKNREGTENNSNNKNIDPHGLGIDITKLKPGEDPSNGECPFLAARSKQQKQNNNSNNANNNGNDSFTLSQVVTVGGMMFIAGFSCGMLMFKK